MTLRRYLALLASSIGILLAALLVGLALGGTDWAVRAAVLVFGVSMLGFAAYILVLALRTRHPTEEWDIVVGYVVLRTAAGASAIWVAFNGGAVAGWMLAACVLGTPAWGIVMRRRHGMS